MADMTVLLLALLLPAAADAGTQARRIEHGGLRRSYRLHVPPDLKKPAPLVVVLHGGGGRGRGMERMSGFSELADKEGFLVAYPDGEGRNWFDGRQGDFSKAHKERRDDAGFVAAMIEEIARDFEVDRARVYATGISNGGFFSHYLGATRSELFAAIAPVVGGLADPFHKEFAPKRPVAVLVAQGTEDPLVPYAGGGVSAFKRERGRLIPTGEALRLWVKADGCGEALQETELPDADPRDGCRVKRLTWTSCKKGTEVQLLRMEGAGHTWPSGPQYLPKMMIGGVCRDFGSAYIWEFFKAHPRVE